MTRRPNFSTLGDRQTRPLVWCAAIVCTILTLAVIIAGIVTVIEYFVIHPRVPYVSVLNAHLDRLRIDYAGILEIKVTIVIRAQNGNKKAQAKFSHSGYILSLDGEDVAQLVAPTFEISKNSSIDFNYVIQSLPIPLGPEQAEDIDVALKKDLITFDFKGSTRVRWRIGSLGSVGFLCHLNCQLHFHPFNGTYVTSRCTSETN